MTWKSIYTYLDKHRVSQGFSWRQLGREIGLHSSTFTRLKHGRGLSIHNIVLIDKSVPGLMDKVASAAGKAR